MSTSVSLLQIKIAAMVTNESIKLSLSPFDDEHDWDKEFSLSFTLLARKQAKCKAVDPLLFCLFGSAPFSRSNLAISILPDREAACNAVFPNEFSAFMHVVLSASIRTRKTASWVIMTGQVLLKCGTWEHYIVFLSKRMHICSKRLTSQGTRVCSWRINPRL